MDNTLPSPKKIRCAIYTRKSTDEGLSQEFNSLDAQFEACSAYIASQKHEGWKLSKNRYDDGGVSGGTMDRPGLNSLLNDIDAGLIDMIVVYKIDRLTRSLSDFSKIVDRLDAQGASFVSVTQSFNTATSMGRLTLNMLLSFAQFEREVTAERIRDKIAASKAKGLWMGGTVPLGYDPNPDKNIRGLIVNKAEAAHVKQIFLLYDQYANLSHVNKACQAQNIRSKYRPQYTTHLKGGGVLTNGQIHHILTNPLYIGKIRHKSTIYEGQHEAIIANPLWERIQEKLQSASARKRGRLMQPNNKYHAPLTGKVFDETDDRLTPTHTKKSGRILRYYISNRLIKAKDPTGWRLPAKEFEAEISKTTQHHLANTPLTILPNTPVSEYEAAQKQLYTLSAQNAKRILSLVKRIDLSTDNITIQLDMNILSEALHRQPDQLENLAIIDQKLTFKKRGHGRKLIIGEFKPEPNGKLIKDLSRATHWLQDLKAGQTLTAIAKREGKSPVFIRKRLKLALLSPKIQTAIVTGQHPDHWNTDMLIRTTSFPMEWEAQSQRLGFES